MKYCKAFTARQLGSFDGFRTDVGAEEVLFLHANLVVTRGIYADQDVVFESNDPAWTQFCHTELGFEVPDFARSSPSAHEQNP
jgi:hypothetical protein